MSSTEQWLSSKLHYEGEMRRDCTALCSTIQHLNMRTSTGMQLPMWTIWGALRPVSPLLPICFSQFSQGSYWFSHQKIGKNPFSFYVHVPFLLHQTNIAITSNELLQSTIIHPPLPTLIYLRCLSLTRGELFWFVFVSQCCYNTISSWAWHHHWWEVLALFSCSALSCLNKLYS